MRKLATLLFAGLLCLSALSAFAQKTDTDQLLREGYKDLRQNDYTAALQKAEKGIELAPDYVDFYLLAGRAEQKRAHYDKARMYYQTAMARNKNYEEEAYSCLIEVELAENHFDKAREIADEAIAKHPDTREFRIKKMEIYQLELDEKTEYTYVKTLRQTYPKDETVLQRYQYLESKFDNERMGINYSFTAFDRDQYGPWHLASVNYIRERGWGSVIGRLSYANRLADGATQADGIQYEAETYLFSGKSSYHYGGAAYSEAEVFPRWRAGYSFFHNFRQGWEGDLGMRYQHAGGRDFLTAVLGMGKYIGSYWINLRTFIQKEKNEIYPAFAMTTRYYFDTRFDYIQATSGYGTSPDDRTALGQFEQRVAYHSFRLGAGYFRLFGVHYITGISGNWNKQEYVPGKKQNEYEISLLLQYKL